MAADPCSPGLGGRAPGASTCQVRSPSRPVSPAKGTRTGMPARSAAADTAAAPSGGSRRPVVSSSSTSSAPSTPASPPTWSAWKCVRTSVGTSSTSSRSRHPRIGPGSGPVSTTSARPSPALSTRLSPCPTSHATSTQPSGGQPGLGSGLSTTSAIATTQHAVRPRLARTQPDHQPASTHSSTRTSSASGRAAHSTDAVGSRARCTPTSTIQAPLRPPSRPSSAPTGGTRRYTSPPSSPSTVAGATAGAAAMLATTATRLTSPDKPATTGVQASCAARGTATASAAQRGSHRPSRSRNAGARNRIPAVASTDRAKPGDTTSHGSTSSSTTVATPRARAPRARPWRPSDSSATEPIAAARTTLGSGRASTTNPTTPSTPTAVRPRARTPSPRATRSRNPTTSVRFVPDTAVRWVSPQVRNASTTSGDMRRSSPTTSAGTRARASGLPRTASRMPRRTASAPASAPSGDSITVGEDGPVSTAPTSGRSGGARRAVPRTSAPSFTRAQGSSPTSTTGVRTENR